MGASWIKSITESNLTSLYGPITNLDISKIEQLDDGYKVEGTFRMSFGYGEYTFAIVMDSKGNIKTYQKNKSNESRVTRFSNV